MGNNQGVIWNDSDLTIQYFIYGAFEEVNNIYRKLDANPKLSYNGTNAEVNVEGFQAMEET